MDSFLESLKQHKKSRPFLTTTSVTTTSIVAIPADPNRTSMIICPPNGADVTFSPVGPVTAGNGIIVRTTDPAYPLSIWLFGSAVRGPWYAITAAGTATVTVITSSRGDS